MSEQQVSAQDTTAPEKSMEDRVADMLFGADPDAESPAERPDEPPPSDETTDADEGDLSDVADQLPDDDAAPETTAAGELDLTYNGQPLKVSLDEARTLAQLGKFHQEKQSEMEQQWASAAKMVEQAQVLANQTTPQLMQIQGTIALYDHALQSFDMGEMRRLARDDPASYLDKQAERDSLMQQRQQAAAQYQQLANEANAKMAEARQGLLSQEAALAQKLLPRMKSAPQETAKTLVEYLQNSKTRPQTIEAINNNAELLAMAYKSSQYDRLQASKKERVQTAQQTSATLKPGPANQMDARTRAMLDARKDIKRSSSDSAKSKAIQRYLETKF